METKITFNPLDKTEVQVNLEIMEFLASKCGVETSELKVRELEFATGQQNNKIIELTKELESVSKKLISAEDEKKRLSEVTSKIDEKDAEIQNLTADFDAQKNKMQLEIDNIKNQKNKAEQDWNIVRQKLNGEINRLTNETKTLNNKIDALTNEKDTILKQNLDMAEQLKAYGIGKEKNKKFNVVNGVLKETVDEDQAYYLATPNDDGGCLFSFNIEGKKRTGIKERSTYLEPFCDILEAADNPSRIILVASGLAKAEGATLKVIEQAKIKLV